MKKDATLHGVYPEHIEELISTVQSLSLAKDLNSIVEIVRHQARKLTGADGATFVLKDNGMCYYVDEDAVAPLWKGKRFPMETCISGWAMLNKQAAVIEDIYQDDRIPIDAYRPTFVKSLVMVPIRTQSPIGAIGNYWASKHKPTIREIEILQALADSTSVAMENAQLYESLSAQVENYKSLSKELKSSLDEKEVLLQEVYHRVKNNLQIVSSLLNLQAETIVDTESKYVLSESISRIYAMSIVHEMLYRSANKASIKLDDYIGNLVKNICSLSGNDSSAIKMSCEINPIILNIDQAIPCGLIVNELIANVYKHARKGDIVRFNLSITLDHNHVVIQASDDNVMRSQMDNQVHGKLGLNLVKQLAKQLDGSIAISNSDGNIIKVTFPHN